VNRMSFEAQLAAVLAQTSGEQDVLRGAASSCPNTDIR
jgi:hypothetical protein